MPENPVRLKKDGTLAKKPGRKKGVLMTPNADQIKADALVWISKGKTLSEFLRQPGMPSRAAFDAWRRQDDVYASDFARAREVGADVIAEECIAIADDARNDWMEREGGFVVNAEHIQRSKLRIETRLKLLAKWQPKKYGDKNEIAVSNPDGTPLSLTVGFVQPKPRGEDDEA